MFLSKLNLNWFVSGSRLLSDSKAIFMSTSDGAALSMNRIQMCKKYDFFYFIKRRLYMKLSCIQ